MTKRSFKKSVGGSHQGTKFIIVETKSLTLFPFTKVFRTGTELRDHTMSTNKFAVTLVT